MQPMKLLMSAIAALGVSSAALAQDQAAETSYDAAPWRISASLAGSAGAGLVVQAAASHDDLLGPLGVRLAAEYGFTNVPFSVTAGIIDVAPLGPIDIHGGLGLGVSFESTGALLYTELLLGASYRFSEHFGAYAEARFRPYFDGTADGIGGLAAGIQFRF